jgi:serine protease Do
MVVATKPGATVPVMVIRDNQRRTLNVTVDELDLEAEAGGRLSRNEAPEQREQTTTGLGLLLEAVTADVARELELPRNRGGAVVVGVDRNSPAALAGLREYDVILEVNRQPVSNVSQVTKALQSAAPGAPIGLLIWREGQEQFFLMRR